MSTSSLVEVLQSQLNASPSGPREWIVESVSHPAFPPAWTHRCRLELIQTWVKPVLVEPDGEGGLATVRATLFSESGLTKVRFWVGTQGNIERREDGERLDWEEERRKYRNRAFEAWEIGLYAEAEAAAVPAIDLQEALRLDGVPQDLFLLKTSHHLLGHCLRARGDRPGAVASFVRARHLREPGVWAPTLFASQGESMNALTFGSAVTAMPPDWLPPDLAGVRVNQIQLPFYPGAVLWQVFDSPGQDPLWLLDGGGDLWELDIVEEPILEANAKVPLVLTAETVVPYLRFYGAFEWFYQGPSYLLDGPDHPGWGLLTEAPLAEDLNRFRPPRVLASEEPGSFTVESWALVTCLDRRRDPKVWLEALAQTVGPDGRVEEGTEDED